MAVVKKNLVYLKSQEKFIALIDANPFGVKLNLKQELMSSLKLASEAVGFRPA